MEDAVEYYNAIAKSYEKLYRNEQIGKIKFILKQLNINKIKTVLDIGAGTGILEEFLRDKKIVAVEPSKLSEEMVRKGLENVKVVRRNIEDISFDERFDLVVCLTTLQDLNESNRAACIKKAFEFCKEGGTIVISVLKASRIDLSYLKPFATGEVENDIVFFFNE